MISCRLLILYRTKTIIIVPHRII